MRVGWGALCLAFVVAGCARPAPREAEASAEVDGESRALPSHDVYEVLARTRLLLGERELAAIRSRVFLYVEERGRRGVSLRARVARLDERGETAGFSDVEVELDRRGGLAHDPLSICDDADIDDLSPTRIVRHVLGSLAPWDGNAEGRVSLDFSEIDVPMRFRYRRGAEMHATGSASARLGRFTVAGWRIQTTSETHVRVEEELDEDDALVMRTRIVAEVVGDVTDIEGRSRSGVIEVRSDIVARPSSREPEAAETCESAFSVNDVIAQVDEHRPEITSCYEAELANDPTLHGRLEIGIVVLPSGEVTGVHVAHDGLTTPAVGACVVEVLRRLHFVEGPVGELRYQFPFVFEPSG